MPELPEVETIRRGLNKLVIGKIIKSAVSDNPRSFPNALADVRAFLVGAQIIDVRRRAKVLMIDLSSQYTLVTHLKMTGQLVYVGLGNSSDDLIEELPQKSTRVIIEFSDGSHLYFNDQRTFGWMRLIPTSEVPNIDFMKRVGPEPLETNFSAAQFADRFARRSKTSIKAALLDQSVVAGVGNIYADESLWGAMIHPSTQVGDLPYSKFKLLYSELRCVLNLSIDKGGSTNRNYLNAEGKKGSYMDFARVFRREGQNCPRCGAEIVKIRVAGRGTHLCPTCQRK